MLPDQKKTHKTGVAYASQWYEHFCTVGRADRSKSISSDCSKPSWRK